MPTTHPLIAAALAMPHTHEAVLTYADGRVEVFTARSITTAETRASGLRRKIGRDLIDRETGETVRYVSVDVRAIERAAA